MPIVALGLIATFVLSVLKFAGILASVPWWLILLPLWVVVGLVLLFIGFTALIMFLNRRYL